MKRPSGSSFVSRLFQAFFHEECQLVLHVSSSQQTKYRNKILYALPLQGQPICVLASDEINQVCMDVDEWNNQNLFLLQEVMVKSSRRGKFLIRVTVVRTMIDWGPSLVSFLSSKPYGPNVECICYNETAIRSRRPSKTDPYFLLYGEHFFVMETTSMGGLSYQIGPDSFSEINPAVEAMQDKQTQCWIQDHFARSSEKGPILLLSGRDISAFALVFGSIKVAREGLLFSHIVACQHCPLVHADAVANFNRNSSHLPPFTLLHADKPSMADTLAGTFGPLQQRQPSRVMAVLTGGRHGLDASFVDYLIRNRHIECLVYNSCSTKSLIRDMERLLLGDGDYYVADFKSYDFLPNTSYTASLTLLLRRPRTLVLPIGPAGIGKSALAKHLVTNMPTVRWWERDAIFRDLRESGLGLQETKRLVHCGLLAFLKPQHDPSQYSSRTDDSLVHSSASATPSSSSTSRILVIDSCNGNEAARSMYVEESKACLTLLVELHPPHDIPPVDFLMERTKDRLESNISKHPSFPISVSEQLLKHHRILRGISYPSEGVEDCCQSSQSSGSIATPIYPPSVATPRRVVLSSCATAPVGELAFVIFLEICVCDHLRAVLGKSVGILGLHGIAVGIKRWVVFEAGTNT
jgi:hypothetical protein